MRALTLEKAIKYQQYRNSKILIDGYLSSVNDRSLNKQKDDWLACGMCSRTLVVAEMLQMPSSCSANMMTTNDDYGQGSWGDQIHGFGNLSISGGLDMKVVDRVCHLLLHSKRSSSLLESQLWQYLCPQNQKCSFIGSSWSDLPFPYLLSRRLLPIRYVFIRKRSNSFISLETR